MRVRDRSILAAIVWVLLGAVSIARHAPTTDSPVRASFVTVAPGVELEVLDWGGGGPPLVLLSGLGNSAHVFEEFARRFTDRFHVLAVTRRGFGASAVPKLGYDVATLAHDVLMVLDQRKIDRAILVGHSIAGDEMTTFAAAYPTRVAALVYLDAAYDRAHRPALTGPDQQPSEDDKWSVDAYNGYFLRTRGWRFTDAEMWAVSIVDEKGRLVPKTPVGISKQIIDGVVQPPYAKVQAPVLAIYAPLDVRFMYPNVAAFTADDRARAEGFAANMKAWQDAAITLLRREVAHARVVVLDSGEHYVFLTNQDEVVRLIRGFLAETSPPKAPAAKRPIIG